MTTKIIKINLSTEQQIDKEMARLSKKNPTKIITAYASFGTTRFYLRDRQPSTDHPDTIQTFEYYGGFFKNGRVVKPTSTWMSRYNFIPVTR